MDDVSLERSSCTIEPGHMHLGEVHTPEVDPVSDHAGHVAESDLGAQRTLHGSGTHAMSSNRVERCPFVGEHVCPAPDAMPCALTDDPGDLAVCVAGVLGLAAGEEAFGGGDDS